MLQNQNPQSLSQDLQNQPQKQPDEQQNQSPNLLDKPIEYSLLQSFNNAPLKASTFMFKVILGIQTLFLVVFFANFLLDLRLNYLSTQLKDKSTQILSYSEIEKDTKRLMDKIDTYKNLSASRKLTGADTSFIIAKTSGVVTLDYINVSPNLINLRANAESPIAFSLLINNYFANKNVSGVVLKSASLDRTKNVFLVDIDVIFK